jgi:hypothetical protein
MAEIEKIAVYDPRIIQEPARYAVQQGALSVSTAQFQATSATPTNLSFQVLVPSLNVFIDRKIELNTGVTVYSEVVPSQTLQVINPTLNAAGTAPRTYPDGSPVVQKVVVAQPYYTDRPNQLPELATTSQDPTSGLTIALNSAYILEPSSFVGQGAGASPAAPPTGDPVYTGLTGLGNCGDYWYQPIGIPQDLYPTMFPVQSLCNSMTVTVNDCSISLVGDTLKEQLLLAQTRDSIQQRTCPSKFDIYAWGQDDAHAANGNSQGYDGARDSDIPNGSWPLLFVNPNDGKPLPRFGQYVCNGVAVPVINWRPAIIPSYSGLMNCTLPEGSTRQYNQTTYGATDVSKPLPIMYRLNTVEPLAISPFLWQDSKQMSEVGLYGITNMTISMNLNNAGASVAYDTLPSSVPSPFNQSTGVGTVSSSFIGYFDRLSNSLNSYSYMTRQAGIFALYGNTKLMPSSSAIATQNGPWIAPRVFCTFLTPPPNTPLPLVSCVPYVEFPRYTSSSSADFSKAGSVSVYTNTITLSSIPDVLVVFAKANFRGQTQGDAYIPISQVSVNFDNYSNLCSNYSQEDLYACSVAAGLDMDYSQFRGYARSNAGTFIPTTSAFLKNLNSTILDQRYQPSSNKQLTGSPVLLRMGQDIPLSSGLAPGTLGNYSVQVTLTLDNSQGFFSWLSEVPASSNVAVTIMGVNSGFFESCKGSSAIRKTILNTVDVESVSASTSVTATQLQRLVGGSGMRTSAGLTNTMAVPRFMPASSTASMDERPRKYGRTLGSMIG